MCGHAVLPAVATLRWVPFIGQFLPLKSLTWSGGTGFRLSEDLVWSSASQSAVWPYMAVPPEEAGQAHLSVPTMAVGVQVHFLVLELAP